MATIIKQKLRPMLIVFMMAAFTPFTFADVGGNSSGGGGPDAVAAGALKLLIQGGGLKRAMQNYLNTIRPEHIEDEQVKATIVRMTEGNALLTDVLTPNNYFISSQSEPCVDAFNQQVPASTLIGKPGARVCFDIAKLIVEYKGLSEEEVMIRLASLAFHEHVHHFQKPSTSRTLIAKNEDEANRVAGYILVTAKFVQIPLLEWAPDSLGDQFDEILKLYTAIRAKERAFLSPSAADYANYPDYKDKSDRGLFRILPRELYDGKLSMRGGGSYYSFSTKSNDYDSIPELELENERLSVGFAGCDFGFIIPLGNMSLDELNLETPGMAFLNHFTPANRNEPEVRKQQSAASTGIRAHGFHYSNRIEGLAAGKTYALRAISFRYADHLVAFRIVRIQKDGSLIIAWKSLKTYPVSSCSN